jgi:hypothetical protein
MCVAQERPALAPCDGYVVVVDGERRPRATDRNRLTVRLHDLWIPRRAAELGGEVEQTAEDVVRRRVLDLDRTVPQAVVDRPAELILDDEVDDERGRDDRQSHRGGRDECQPGTKAHRSRSA